MLRLVPFVLFLSACATAPQQSAPQLSCAPDDQFVTEAAQIGATIHWQGVRGGDMFYQYSLPGGLWFLARSQNGQTCIMAQGHGDQTFLAA